ncbi:MAG: hypothetical protein DRQ37_00215 [Gammaproteobacteria bacterium]|nr:MAG: hypothetical protein DRQ37_00215 [Gammaproteobacteria bacterium]
MGADRCNPGGEPNLFFGQLRAVNGHVLKLALCALLVLSPPTVVSAADPLEMQVFAQVTRASGEKVEITVEDGGVLRSGDGVQVRVRTTQDAYVYVIALGSSGRAVLLYPLSGRSGESRVSAGEERVVPGAGIYVPLDGQAGREALFGIASTTPINDIDSLVRRVEGQSGEPTVVTQMLRGRYRDVSALVFRHIGQGPLRGVDYMAQDMARRISRQPRARPAPPPAPERKYGLLAGEEGAGSSSPRGWDQRPSAAQASSIPRSSADVLANTTTPTAPGALAESQPMATFPVPEEPESAYEEPGVLSGEGSRIRAIMGGGRKASGSSPAEVPGEASSRPGGTSVAMRERAQETAASSSDLPVGSAAEPESKKEGGLLDRLMAWRRERSQAESTGTGNDGGSVAQGDAETVSDQAPRKISAPAVTIEVPAEGVSTPEPAGAVATVEPAQSEAGSGVFGRLRGFFAAKDPQSDESIAEQNLDEPPSTQSDVAARSGAEQADAPRTFALPGDTSEADTADSRLATADSSTSGSERRAAEELTVTAAASDSGSGDVTETEPALSKETPEGNVAEPAAQEEAPRGGLLSSLSGWFGSKRQSEAAEETPPPAVEATKSTDQTDSEALPEEPPTLTPSEETELAPVAQAVPEEEESVPPVEPAPVVAETAEPAEVSSSASALAESNEPAVAEATEADPAAQEEEPGGGLLSSLSGFFGSKSAPEEVAGEGTNESEADQPVVSPVVTEALAPQEATAATESAQVAGEGSSEGGKSESGVLSSLSRMFSSGGEDKAEVAPEPAKPAELPKPALIRTAPPQEAESGPVVILRGTGPKKKDSNASVLGSEGSKIRQFLGEEAPKPEPEEATVTTTAAAEAPEESTVVETTSERPPAVPPVVTVMVDDPLPQVARLPAPEQALGAIAMTPQRALAEIDVTAPDNVASAVVLVVTPTASGSGVILDNDGHILTNWHLVRYFSAASVLFKDPGTDSPAADGARVARVLRVNKFADLALLKVDSPPETARPIDLAPTVDLKRGQPVHALGHPKGGRWTHSEGMVSGVKATHTWFGGRNVVHRGSVLTARVAGDPGQSGAPILNSSLQMVAISSHLKRPAGLLTAVTVDTVRQFLATPPENTGTVGGG